MDRDKRGRKIADLVISHCVGLERIIERLEEEGLAVKAMSVGSTGALAAFKRGECPLALTRIDRGVLRRMDPLHLSPIRLRLPPRP